MGLIRVNDGLQEYIRSLILKDMGNVSWSKALFKITAAYMYAKKNGYRVKKISRRNLKW